MNNPILKRALISVAALVMLLPVPAAAQVCQQGTSPLYLYTYYSDSSYTIEVGSYHDTCNCYGVGQSQLQGTATAYEQSELIGYCVNGQLVHD